MYKHEDQEGTNTERLHTLEQGSRSFRLGVQTQKRQAVFDKVAEGSRVNQENPSSTHTCCKAAHRGEAPADLEQQEGLEQSCCTSNECKNTVNRRGQGGKVACRLLSPRALGEEINNPRICRHATRLSPSEGQAPSVMQIGFRTSCKFLEDMGEGCIHQMDSND